MTESLNAVDAIGLPSVLSADDPAESVNELPALPRIVNTTTRDFTSPRLLMAGLLLLVALAFANSITGEFVHDDLPQIVNNQMFSHWDRVTLTRVVTRDFWASLQPEVAGNHLNSLYYRPVFSLFLMVSYEFVGRNPAGWHILVMLLHAFCAILAFIVLEKTMQQATALEARPRRLLAAFAAAFFAVHPAQAESVTWIAGLVGPLSTIFMLIAAYCYLNYRQQRRAARLLAMMLSFALALLTKESAIILLLIILAQEMLIFNRAARFSARLRQAALYAWPFALVGAGYMTLRYLALGVWLGRINNLNFPDDQALTVADMLRTWPALLVAYGKLILFPVDMFLIYDFGYVGALGWARFWMPLLILLVAGFLLLRGMAHNIAARLGAIWLLLPLLPHLNTRAFVSDEIIHDRYLYLSLLGAGLLIGALSLQATAKMRRLWPRPMLGLTAVLLATLTLLTLATNRRFQNTGALWTDGTSHTPKSRTVLLARGIDAELHGDNTAAADYYESALAINPDIVDALNNSAFIYARNGHWIEATSRFERIAELSPDRAGGHFNLSFAYAVQHRYREAAREQQTAIELDPGNVRVAEWRARLEDLQRRLTDQVISKP